MNIFQILSLLLIVVVAAVFVLRSKIIELFSKSLPVVFVILIITTISGLFFSGVYRKLSDFTLRTVGIYDVLTAVDDKISVEYWKETITGVLDEYIEENTIFDFFKNDNEEAVSETSSNGILENRLYPVIVDLIGFIYQVAVTIFSLVGMIFVTYLNYNTAEISRLRKLEERIKRLEGKDNF